MSGHELDGPAEHILISRECNPYFVQKKIGSAREVANGIKGKPSRDKAGARDRYFRRFIRESQVSQLSPHGRCAGVTIVGSPLWDKGHAE